MSWWMSHETQKAREEFCEKLAVINDDWVSEWKNQIQKFRHL